MRVQDVLEGDVSANDYAHSRVARFHAKFNIHYGGEVQNRAEWILLCSFMDPEIVFLVGVVYCYLLAF